MVALSNKSLDIDLEKNYGIWNSTQNNYSTIKKKIISIILCVLKFLQDLLNQKFLKRVDCDSAKFVLEKNVKKNIASEHEVFTR